MEEQIAKILGNQEYLYIVTGVLLACFAFDKAYGYFAKKRNHKNNKSNINTYSNPNHAMFMDHEKRITINEQGIKALCSSINDWKKDNKEDHQEIFKRLNNFDEVGGLVKVLKTVIEKIK